MLKSEISPADLVTQARTLMVALNARDSYTNAHCNRVIHLATELGKECGLSAVELRTLRLSAAMHDIGKLGVPDNILLKPGKLDAQEWEIMQSHAVLGQEILSQVDLEDGDRIGFIVRHHHEAYNGSGYPDGLKGEAIPVMSRIITLADGYDAMATTRPYRQAMSHHRIMDILTDEAGRKCDPYLLTKFIPIVEARAVKCA